MVDIEGFSSHMRKRSDFEPAANLVKHIHYLQQA